MPAIVAAAAIAGAAEAYGAHEASSATEDAAQLQSKSTDQALTDARQQRAYQQQQYANYLQRLAPYRAQGQAAVQSLSQSAGVPYRALPDQPSGLPPQTSQPPAAMSGNGRPAFLRGPVQMRAPNGQMQAVSPDQVAHYQSLGAQVVN